MLKKAKSFLMVASMLMVAATFWGCIIDDCSEDYWGGSSCECEDCYEYDDSNYYNDDYYYDCEYYDDCVSGEEQPYDTAPSTAHCDPMLDAYDECIWDFGECFEPCAAFLNEYNYCVDDASVDAECVEIQLAYDNCVEQFGAQFEACDAFLQEMEEVCYGDYEPEDPCVDTGAEEPCTPPEPDNTCVDLELSYEQCLADHCVAHEYCVAIDFELQQNNCY